MNDAEHLAALLRRNFLSVSRICHRLSLVVLQADVSQLAVRNVLDVYPLDGELALPFLLSPDVRRRLVVDGRRHLRDTAEVAAAVDAEEQVDRALAFALAERRIQPLVAVLCAAPDAVLDRPVNVVLRVTLDDEESRPFRAQVELFRVVLALLRDRGKRCCAI